MQPISMDPSPCAGTLPRRAFLRTGLTGLSTLGLADLLRLDARAGDGQPAGGPSLIVIWLWGGPSHLETFDPKPEAPAEYRGAQAAIATNVPGIWITDRLPLLARIADKFCLIRSVAHDSPGHVNATHTALTGYPGELIEAPPYTPKYPDFFTVAHKVLPTRRPGLPQYVGLPQLRYTGGAHLGRSYGPFSVAGDPNAARFAVPNINLEGAARRRLAGRVGLLAAFDRMRADVDRSGLREALQDFQGQALDLLTGTVVRQALDLTSEDPRLRDRYSRTTLGQRCLLARRLVEAGVRLVTVDFPAVPGQKAFSWDDHASVWNIFEQMAIRLPVLDQAISALIEDIAARGLDQRTLIVLMGEMGRTPRLSNHKGQPGREHWPSAMSVLMAGGGMPMGQVIGATTRKGEEPRERRLHPADVLATWYKFLGIDHTIAFADHAGRPIGILPQGEPIRELI
jgi:hypothetical protein